MTIFINGCSTTRLDQSVKKNAFAKSGESKAVSQHNLDDAFKDEAFFGASDEIELNAASVLTYATQYSRELQTRRETLYRSVLDLYQQRRDLGLRFEGNILYENIVSGINDGEEDARASAEIRDTLFSGANLTLGSNANRDAGSFDSDANNYQTRFSLRAEQPLLSGFGYNASHETLIQAEQNLIYELRSFALERQDFAIRTLRSFYDLVFQEAQLKNRQGNVEQSTFLRERSEAMFKVQLAPYIDVLRSKQQELSSKNQLHNAASQVDIAKKRFLISIGLPKDLSTNLTSDIPELNPIDINENLGIGLALAHRLDFLTAQEQNHDADRRLKTARRAMLPDLSLTGEVNYSNTDTNSFSTRELEEEAKVGIRLDIPFDKREERDNLKRAQLSKAQNDRELAERTDTIKLEVASSFSQLEVLSNNVKIEEENVSIAEERVENAVYRFKSGELSNRDVVEAENALLEAKDALVRALIDHEIERFEFLRSIGFLDVSTGGQFIEKEIN